MSQNDYPIIIPKRGRSDPPISPVVVLIFTIEDFLEIRRRYEDFIVLEREIYNSTLLNIDRGGRLLTLVGPILGAPQAVLIVEKLIAMNAKAFLAFGWCGSISPGVRVGDIIIPVSAISDEGTSRHYPLDKKNEARATQELVELLESRLHSAGVSYHVGKVWSTDAPYREMASEVLEYQKQGALAVDMETSALFQVAAFRKVKLAVVLVVSDELFSLKWKPGFRSKKFIDNRKLVTNIILDAEETLVETM